MGIQTSLPFVGSSGLCKPLLRSPSTPRQSIPIQHPLVATNRSSRGGDGPPFIHRHNVIVSRVKLHQPS